jgi:hypothetical protein
MSRHVPITPRLTFAVLQDRAIRDVLAQRAVLAERKRHKHDRR